LTSFDFVLVYLYEEKLLKKYINIIFLVFILLVQSNNYASAESNLQIGAPIVTDSSIQNALNAAADRLRNSLNIDYFNKFTTFSDLSKGFSNSTKMLVNVGESRSFSDYSMFAVSCGFFSGVSCADLKPKTGEIKNDFENTGDSYIGISPVAFVSVGSPAYIVGSLNVSGKIGGFSIDTNVDEYRFKGNCFLIGLSGDYSFIKGKRINTSLYWKGITFATGITYIYNLSEIQIPLDKTYSEAWITDSYTGFLKVNNLHLDLKSKVNSISLPIEIKTAFQMLNAFSLGIGSGFDLNYTDSKISTSGHASVRTTLPYGVVQSSPGSLSFSTSSKRSQNLSEMVSPKILISCGCNISVVKIDIPFIWYPTQNTYGLGITLGAIW
jgi:hypothetical protein